MSESDFACKYCGAPLSPEKAVGGVVRCAYCGNDQTVPKKDASPAVLSFLRMGEHDLDTGKFDDAYAAFSKAAELDPEEPEASFGMALSKFRVQFLRDEENGATVLRPICHEISDKYFTEDAAYLGAIACASDEQKAVYRERGKQIDRIREEFFRLKKEGLFYDVFLCAKVSEEENEATQESYDALKLYNYLKKKGLRPFFSETDAAERTGEDYEALILYALVCSSSMLLVCSHEEYLQTKWVKNEYTRFLEMSARAGKRRGALTVLFRGKPVERLPGAEGKIEGIDLSRPDAYSRAEDHVRKYLERSREDAERAERSEKSQQRKDEAILKREENEAERLRLEAGKQEIRLERQRYKQERERRRLEEKRNEAEQKRQRASDRKEEAKLRREQRKTARAERRRRFSKGFVDGFGAFFRAIGRFFCAIGRGIGIFFCAIGRGIGIFFCAIGRGIANFFSFLRDAGFGFGLVKAIYVLLSLIAVAGATFFVSYPFAVHVETGSAEYRLFSLLSYAFAGFLGFCLLLIPLLDRLSFREGFAMKYLGGLLLNGVVAGFCLGAIGYPVGYMETSAWIFYALGLAACFGEVVATGIFEEDDFNPHPKPTFLLSFLCGAIFFAGLSILCGYLCVWQPI